MQLAGPYAFGAPPDRTAAIGVLQAAVAAGVDHIDTAQYYGPGIVNDLIREALYPYPDGLAIVSKVAVRRDDSGAVLPFDDPHQLRDGIEENSSSRRYKFGLAWLTCSCGRVTPRDDSRARAYHGFLESFLESSRAPR
jgi:aryl-alcohol dehydrogenase-like predicted oxidoreductase